MGILLKFLLIFVGVYLIGKAILKSILSRFLGNSTQKMSDRLQKQEDEMIRHKKKTEGRVTVNYQPKSDKNFRKTEGDYVDFEEVK